MNQYEGKIVTIGIAATENIVVATVVVCNMDGSNVEASPITLTKSTPSRNYKEIITVQETIEKGLKSSVDIIIDTHGIGGCFYDGLKDRTHRVYAEVLSAPCPIKYSNRFFNKAAHAAYSLQERGNFKNVLSVNDNGQWHLPVGTLHEDAFIRSVIAAYANTLGSIVESKPENNQKTVIGVSTYGQYCCVALIRCNQDGSHLTYESTFVDTNNYAKSIATSILKMRRSATVVTNLFQVGWDINKELQQSIGSSSHEVILSSRPIGANQSHTLRDELCELFNKSNPNIISIVSCEHNRNIYRINPKRSETKDKAELDAILSAYSLFVDAPNDSYNEPRDALHDVLNMPVERWSNSGSDKYQRHARYCHASEIIKSQDSQITELEDQRKTLQALLSQCGDMNDKNVVDALYFGLDEDWKD